MSLFSSSRPNPRFLTVQSPTQLVTGVSFPGGEAAGA
jgi:hypothetical protein